MEIKVKEILTYDKNIYYHVDGNIAIFNHAPWILQNVCLEKGENQEVDEWTKGMNPIWTKIPFEWK